MKVFFSDAHQGHQPSTFLSRGQVAQCPEVAERAVVMHEALSKAGFEVSAPTAFGIEPLRRVHDAPYLDFLATAWEQWCALGDHADEIVPNVHPGRHMAGRPAAIVGQAGYYQADTACPIGAGTWKAARASTEVALSAADAVVTSGARDCAYALCRPPGHHAFSDMAGGFCFLNNTAIAAQYCRDQGAARVAIVDVDVHHGNGTQQIFYSRGDVLTVSLHGDPAHYYPFYLGYAHEHGVGEGDGANLNVPLAQGTGDDAYLAELRAALERLREFDPQVLVVALGLDASEHDGHHPFLKITTGGFSRIGRALGALALPTVLVQEGGYLSDFLGANLVAALEGFKAARA